MRQSTIPDMRSERQQALADADSVDKYVKMKTTAWEEVLKMLKTPLLDEGNELCDEDAMENPVSAQRRRTLEASNVEDTAPTAATGPEPDPKRELGVLAAFATAFGHETPAVSVATPEAKQAPVRRRRKQPRDNSIGMSRRAFYSINDWSPKFLEWMNKFCAVLMTAMVTFDRGYRLQGMNVTYAAKGQCSRCRRKTRGLSELDSINKRLDSYVFYTCGCPSKTIGHCIRCTVFEYIIEARRIHGDFRITDDAGEVVGLREIPCIEKCTTDEGAYCTWSLASLMAVGPPNELERAAIRSSGKKKKKSAAKKGVIPLVRRKKRPGSKPVKRRPKQDVPVARD